MQGNYEKLVPRLLWKLINFLHIDIIIVPILLRMYLINTIVNLFSHSCVLRTFLLQVHYSSDLTSIGQDSECLQMIRIICNYK